MWDQVIYHRLRCAGEDCTRVSQALPSMAEAQGFAANVQAWQQHQGRWLCPLCWGELLPQQVEPRRMGPLSEHWTGD